jgi:hypothetical protein
MIHRKKMSCFREAVIFDEGGRKKNPGKAM